MDQGISNIVLIDQGEYSPFYTKVRTCIFQRTFKNTYKTAITIISRTNPLVSDVWFDGQP